MGHSRPLFLYFRLFNTVDSKVLSMTRFEPRTSGIWSDRSTNWATTLPNLFISNGTRPGAPPTFWINHGMHWKDTRESVKQVDPGCFKNRCTEVIYSGGAGGAGGAGGSVNRCWNKRVPFFRTYPIDLIIAVFTLRIIFFHIAPKITK